MRWVIPLIMGLFLLIGLALFLGIRASEEQTRRQQHRADLESLVASVNAQFQQGVSNLLAQATQRDLLDFARETLVSSTSSANLNAAQARLLGTFTDLLRQHPNYLAVRYVTFNGSVWSEVTNFDSSVPRAASAVRPGALATDPTLTEALSLAPGQALVSDITFQLNPNAPILDRLIPYIRISSPVAPDSSFDTNISGVVQLDLQAAPILNFIASTASSEAMTQMGRRVVVANSAGSILYDSATPTLDTLRLLALRQSPLVADQFPQQAALLQSAQVDGEIVDNNVFSVSRLVFGGTANAYWTIALIDSASLLAGSETALPVVALVTSLAIGALICMLISFILRRTLLPVGTVDALVRQWTSPADSSAPAAPVAALPPSEDDGDEIGQLMGAFQSITGQVESLKTELETTQQRYNRNLDITSRVSRETAILHDIDQVLNRAINLICDEFGFYHAQVFLVDDVGENAVLVYSHGDIGRQLLEARHKIPIGSASVIGQATSTGQAVVVNDTNQTSDAPHRFNPLLPETRAEVALPLLFGDRILGAFDVQSRQPDSFQDDEVRSFQILADQIAIAMQNVRLLAQSEQRIAQIDALNRQLTRSTWEDTTQTSNLEQIYRYDLLTLSHDEPELPPSFSLPITIRGEVIGTLDAAPPDGTFFTEGDYSIMRAVADRVAIAIENARLFEEAQLQALRSQALAEAGQLASRMSREFVQSLEEVFERIAQPANYDRWVLTLADETASTLEVITARLSPEFRAVLEGANLLNLAADFSPMVQVYKTGRLLVINDPLSFPGHEGNASAPPDVFGKTVMIPVQLGAEVTGVLMLGRPLNAPDLAESDEQLATTLASQVSIALENQRLLRAAESERERLGSILATLPAGVLVLDPVTYKPIQFNNQVEQLLGRHIAFDQPFDAETYGIYRSGTDAPYPRDILPIFAASQAKQLVASDDITVIREDGSDIDLLMNAVPILNEDGSVQAIVGAFQDISALRNLERTLETNLRDTVALYEATRALAEAEEVDDVYDEVLAQLAIQEAVNAYILLNDQQGSVQIVRALSGATGDWRLPRELLDAQESLFIGDIESTDRFDDDLCISLLGENIHALVSIPLRARSRGDAPIGWMVILFDQPQEFTAESEQFLNTLSDSAAVALDNRSLLRSTELALQDTALLYGATTNLSRARSEDEIGEAVQGALDSLAPDLYAGYLFVETGLNELFNIGMDSAPIQIGTLISQHNLLESENVFVSDLREPRVLTPFERDLIALGNVRAYALVHLRSQDIPNGVFFIGYHQPHAFAAGDVRYLSAVADSASVVINNYLLLDQIQGSLEETSILYQASRALNDASTPQEILNVVVTHLISRPVTQIFLALLSTETWDHPKALAQVVATWQREGEVGIDLAGISLVADQYPAWRLLASPNVLVIDDVSDAPELDMMERIGVESLELRSISILPLRIAGRSIGAFVIGGREPYHHNDRDLRIYGSLAEQASLRMEAVRLLAQTERRARQLTTSAEVSQIASSILDLNDLLPRIVDVIRDAFGYDHAQIFLMDEQNEYATLRASTGEAGRQLLEVRHRLKKGSSSVIGQVTESGTPVIASDTADALVVHRPNPYLPNTRSEMAIPLKLQGRVVGAVDVQSNLPNAFDDDDIQVLTTLAAQVSVAIDNAQLFEQSRRRANEMSFLFDVTTAAASAETLQLAIQNVASELRNSLNALSVSIYLPQTYLNNDDEEVTILHPVALAGSDQPLSELSEVRLDSSNSLIAESARARRSTIVDDVEERGDYLPVVDGARSAIVVPLSSGAQQLIGLVALESGELAAYDNDTLTLLLTLSGTLSAIIQNQQLLEQVQETNEQLRELDRLKSDFLANMSHELRTPLNSIIGFSRVILKGIDGALTEMQEQDLTTIYNSGLHLLNLINDILDQAKIAAGKMDLQIDHFEMKNVIDGVRSIGIGLVKDKPIDIFVDIAPGLPKAFGDEFRTRQVLINLVSNAAKFTREGTITISCYPVRDEENNLMMVRTDVTDTGIGIADKDMALLFEAFRQVDSSLTRTQGGTGLGLPISKSLVEMQNGRMVVSSKVNVGSTFSILMPTGPITEQPKEESLKKTAPLSFDNRTKSGATGPLMPVQLSNGTHHNDEAPSAAPESNGMPPYIHVKRQILLIEDNPDMVDQYRRALQGEGFDIYTASIPLEAEAMASGLHPTIIIMDVNFSGGQGWNILGKLKARDDTFDIPVIVVTLSNDVERAEQMGAFRFIQRPFSPDDLALAVQEAEVDSRIDRILIIDDQPESVRLLTQVLEQQGQYRVFSAGSGADGIALVARRRPNLVILDLRMPEMDGFRVVEELRGNPETATIPILVVTGDSVNAQEREQLNNLAVLEKGAINAETYQQFIKGVRENLNGE